MCKNKVKFLCIILKKSVFFRVYIYIYIYN